MNDAKQAEVKDRVKHENNSNSDTVLHNNGNNNQMERSK